MKLDIETTVRTLFVFLLIATGVMIFTAVRAFREAARLRFFLKKRELLSRAWKFVFFSILIFISAIFINSYAEPLTYSVFPPSPTASLTPTVTLTSTITVTPTITNTPTITETPEVSPTPIMPAVIGQEFTSQTTPNPNARFSNLVFSTNIDEDYQPINPSDSFENPLDTIYGAFSYDQMITNSQWSSLWFRDGELIFYETKPWNGASGGFGFTDCQLPAADWLPGEYEVQLFAGETWKVSGFFSVTGTPPTPTITPTATLTNTPTITPTPSPTLQPTGTPVPSFTMTLTPSLTNTVAVAAAILPTQTISPTALASATTTPSQIPTITTSEPTIVPTATRRSTFYR